ncbi:hypothetical protein [Streptomyces sp. NPDC056491]|uniref:hypothetical protein n=1 Tax=Streptomyces sp. NPDC056491 TaxID=3345837 RepID=UPI0036AA0BFE
MEIGVALILAQLGYVAEMRGDAPLAESLHRDGLAAGRRPGDPRALVLALEGLAGARSVAATMGDRASGAAALLGTAAALRESLGTPLHPAERHDVDRAEARLRAALGEEAFAAALAHGRALPPQAQVALIERTGPTSATGPTDPAAAPLRSP